MKLLLLAVSVIMAFPAAAQSDPWQEYLERHRQRDHEEAMQKRALDDAQRARDQQSERDQQLRYMLESVQQQRQRQQPQQEQEPTQYRNCIVISNIVRCY
jgi:hypothetical protein